MVIEARRVVTFGEKRELVIWREHEWGLVMFYFLTWMVVPRYVCFIAIQ